MDRPTYVRLADDLVANLSSRDEVVGLVAVGSFATGPDEYSDHDFLVVARSPEEAQGLRRDVTWLPDADRLVLVFRETAHGVKVVYDDGHLMEFSVFLPDEIRLAAINRSWVLFDKADVRQRVDAAREATASRAGSPEESDAWLVGQFLTAMLVGVQRHRRGERMSAVDLVHRYGLRHFLVLLARHVPAENPDARDHLNPFRRVELAWPAVGMALSALFSTGNLEKTALGLFDLASDLFRPHLTDASSPDAAWTSVRAYLTTR